MCTDALQEPDTLGLERGQWFGEHLAERVDVEQQHVGGLVVAHCRHQPGSGVERGHHLGGAIGLLEVSEHRVARFGRTHQHHPGRALPRQAQSSAEVAAGHEDHRAGHEQNAQVETGHEVPVEENEGHAVHTDADGHGQAHAGQPGAVAEARLAFVQTSEVADGEVDGRGDPEAHPVVAQRVGGPVEAEAHEVDGHHEAVEGQGVEDEKHSEPASPQGHQARGDPAAEPAGGARELAPSGGLVLTAHAPATVLRGIVRGAGGWGCDTGGSWTCSIGRPSSRLVLRARWRGGRWWWCSWPGCAA